MRSIEIRSRYIPIGSRYHSHLKQFGLKPHFQALEDTREVPARHLLELSLHTRNQRVMLDGIQNNWSKMNKDPAINIKWKKKEKRMELFFLALVMVIIAFVAMISSGGLKSTSFAADPSTSAKFIGTVAHVAFVDGRSVSVKYSIKNGGHSSGTPNCTLTVQDPSGSFPGFSATIISRSISAGHTLSSKMSVPVAGPGPQYVTQGKIYCN